MNTLNRSTSTLAVLAIIVALAATLTVAPAHAASNDTSKMSAIRDALVDDKAGGVEQTDIACLSSGRYYNWTVRAGVGATSPGCTQVPGNRRQYIRLYSTTCGRNADKLTLHVEKKRDGNWWYSRVWTTTIRCPSYGSTTVRSPYISVGSGDKMRWALRDPRRCCLMYGRAKVWYR